MEKVAAVVVALLDLLVLFNYALCRILGGDCPRLPDMLALGVVATGLLAIGVWLTERTRR